MNNYYLGFLVSWHYSNARTKASQSPLKGNYYFSHQFQLKSYINAFIKPGYRLTPKAMMYGVIGPSIANWSHTTDEFRINNLTNVTSLTDTFKLEKRTIGLGIGCGFEYLLKRKWALSFEYVSYIHRSESASKQISYIERVAGVNASRSGDLLKIVKPSYSTFAVRLTRFFSLF